MKYIKLIIATCLSLFSISCFALDEKELKEITHKAEIGEAKAQLQLGQHYFENRNVFNVWDNLTNTGDLGDGFKWCFRAAYQGYPEAQVEIGDRFRSESNPITKSEAVYWYKKAAEQNYENAFERIAVYYESIDDIEQATLWYQKYLDCMFTKNGKIDGFTKLLLPKYVKKYSPVKDNSFNEVRFESYYTIGGRTKNDWDTISESEDPAFTVYAKIYDDHIEVDGVEYYYDMTFKGYKLYRSTKTSLFGSENVIYYGIDQNYNLIYQKDTFVLLVKSSIWTDSYKGKADDEDIDKSCNDIFFNTKYRMGSYEYDLDFFAKTECVSEEEDGIAVPVGIYRSKTNPNNYFFSFYVTESGVNYNQAFRIVKETNTIKGTEYNYKGIDTLRGAYFYFNAEL